MTALPFYAKADDLDAVLQGFDDASEETMSEQSLDDALEGFDGEPFDAEEKGEGGEKESQLEALSKILSLNGAATLSSHYNYLHHEGRDGENFYGLSRLRGKLGLDAKLKLFKNWEAAGNGYAHYDAAKAVSDEELSEIELSEAFLRGNLASGLDLKVGRQIVVWGKSDNLRVTDVLNPLDYRTPGAVDIEDLRLPLTMTRLDWYGGAWNLAAYAVHEIRFNKTPAEDSEFNPYEGEKAKEEIPGDFGSNTEYAAALNGALRGWDVSFYGARIFDDQPHKEKKPDVHLEHSRITMFGAALTAATGPWLLKTEAAYFMGLEFGSIPGEKKNRADALLGVEYAGMADATVSIETALRHLRNYEAAIEQDGAERNELQTAARIQADFLHDRLRLTLLSLRLGEKLDDGGFSRFETAWDLRDALTLKGGLITYHNGKKVPFNAIDESDRVFMELKYSF